MTIFSNASKSMSANFQDAMLRKAGDKAAKGVSKEVMATAANRLAGAVHAAEKPATTRAAAAGAAKAATLVHGMTKEQIIAGAKKPIVIRAGVFHPVNPTTLSSPEGKKMLSQLWDTKKVEQAFTEQSFTQPMQDSYRALRKALNGRPDGQLALQYLLQDKKLTAGGNDAKMTMLDVLQSILDKKDVLQGPKNGINASLLLSQQVQELADVVSISQEHKGVCAATAAGQIMWAIKNPVDYTKFVVDMAADGKAKLPDGTWASRVPDWRSGSDQLLADKMLPGGMSDGRSIPGQLVEPTFMQVAVGKGEVYDNRRDLFVAVNNHAKVVSDGGLMDEQTQTLVSKLYPGENWTVTYPDKATLKESPLKNYPDFHGKREVQTKTQMMNFLKSSASPDAPIPVGVNYQLDGGHELLVTGTSPAAKGGVYIQYINPWGQLEKMHEESFKLSLGSMVSGGSFGGVKV